MAPTTARAPWGNIASSASTNGAPLPTSAWCGTRPITAADTSMYKMEGTLKPASLTWPRCSRSLPGSARASRSAGNRWPPGGAGGGCGRARACPRWVLVPVMFAVIITGVLLGRPTHAGTCAVGMPAAGTMPRQGQSACGSTGRAGQRSTSTAGVASCTGPGGTTGTPTTAHFAVWARDAEASWPSGASSSGLC